jgi:hypothetical protein
MSKKAEAATVDTPLSDVEIRRRFVALVHKTNKNDPRAGDVEELRKMLSDHPGLKLWRSISGVAQATELTVFTCTPMMNDALRECWRERLKQMRQELGYADAPQAEKMLISHVVLCWLRLNLMETRHALHVGGREHSMRQGLYWEKQLTGAQRRYTRAVETLAKVRALTAATRLIESRTMAANAGRAAPNVRLLKSSRA